MSELPDETIKKRLHEIFPDPVTAARIVDMVVRKKPEHYSRKSNLPYYNEHIALLTKRSIDKMILERCKLFWPYESYPEYNRNTLYARLNQSTNFLLDNLDPEGTYRKWRSIVKFDRTNPRGIEIDFLPGFRGDISDLSFDAATGPSREDMPVWRRNMEEWLESESTTPYQKEGLLLSPEEVRELKLSLAQLAGIQCSVNATSVKIIRISQ